MSQQEIDRLRGLVGRLVKHRFNGRLTRRPDWWDSEPAERAREVARIIFDVIAEGIDLGGATSGWIVERLRERGVPVTISDLHAFGLQSVASATVSEADGRAKEMTMGRGDPDAEKKT